MGIAQRQDLLPRRNKTPVFRRTRLLEELWHELPEPRRIDGRDGLDELRPAEEIQQKTRNNKKQKQNNERRTKNDVQRGTAKRIIKNFQTHFFGDKQLGICLGSFFDVPVTQG